MNGRFRVKSKERARTLPLIQGKREGASEGSIRRNPTDSDSVTETLGGHDSNDVLNATAFGLMKEKSMLVGIGI